MSFRNPVSVTPPGLDSDPTTFSINRKIMLTAIIIILFVVILMISLHLYSRWYLFRSRRSHLPHNLHVTNALIFFPNPTRGLDASLINSLPTFTFSSTSTANANANAIECAVCLSEFEETQPCRVLPNCKHMFHVECIDMWFHSHATCPLCRAAVVPIVGDGTLEGSRRKDAEIEIQARDNNVVELEENEFRSPMSRVRSLTRILSRDRRVPAVVSPVPVTEVDVELGRGREESRM